MALLALPPNLYASAAAAALCRPKRPKWATARASFFAPPCPHPLTPAHPFTRPRNPFYKNTKKTVEPHLLSVFAADFYGEELRLVVCGYLRPEANFPSLDALMAAIHGDIAATRARLAGGEAASAALAAHPHLVA